MRVVGGEKKGHKLVAPNKSITRPTGDRIKENVFNILGPWIYNTIVLDLFAGSGAIGIEFLSRGAKFCYFCDNNNLSKKIIYRNLAKTDYISKSKILKMDYRKALKELALQDIIFDYIYIDPPYKKEKFYTTAFTIINKNNLLKKDGSIIVEAPKTLNLNIAQEFCLKKEKIYHNIKILIYNICKG